MILNKNNILDTVSYICSKESSYNKLKKDFEEINNDLIEYKSNKINSEKIFNFFYKKLLNNPGIFTAYIENFNEFKKKLETIEESKQKKIEANNLSGKSFTIDNNEKSWLYFAKQVSKKIFKSFYIIEKGDKLEVYFL